MKLKPKEKFSWKTGHEVLMNFLTKHEKVVKNSISSFHPETYLFPSPFDGGGKSEEDKGEDVSGWTLGKEKFIFVI